MLSLISLVFQPNIIANPLNKEKYETSQFFFFVILSLHCNLSKISLDMVIGENTISEVIKTSALKPPV